MNLVDELQSELDLLLNQHRLMRERHKEEEESLDLKILDLSNRIDHWNTEHAQAERDNESLSSTGCPHCGSYEGDATECPECGHGQFTSSYQENENINQTP